jgi:hypothetical protein
MSDDNPLDLPQVVPAEELINWVVRSQRRGSFLMLNPDGSLRWVRRVERAAQFIDQAAAQRYADRVTPLHRAEVIPAPPPVVIAFERRGRRTLSDGEAELCAEALRRMANDARILPEQRGQLRAFARQLHARDEPGDTTSE